MEDNRLEDPRMDWYKEVYKNSLRLKHRPQISLEGKTIIVYGEQGLGDIIQFSRYIQPLKNLGCKVIFHCPETLHRLFNCLEVDLLAKENDQLPDHDFHMLSYDLPFIVRQLEVDFPYLSCPEVADLGEIPEGTKKVGIAWEGNPNHSNSLQRDCPLKFFRCLEVEGIRLFSLQKVVHNAALLDGCNDIDLYGYEINDFYDTAKLINAMDMVVTIDTSVLHLAGALNKLTYGMLSFDRDPRWDMHHWYHSAVIIRQKKHNDWANCFASMISFCTGMMNTRSEKTSTLNMDKDILKSILED